MEEEDEYEEEEDQESQNKAVESKEAKNPSIYNNVNNEDKKDNASKKSSKSKKTSSKKKGVKNENAYKIPSPEQVVSTRAFLEKTVTSAIQEALLELARKRDEIKDPLLWVGQYLVKKAKEKK